MLKQDVPSLVVGDFNSINGAYEKRGDRHFVNDIEFKEFPEFLESSGLMDLGFISPRFIWCNNQLGGAII